MVDMAVVEGYNVIVMLGYRHLGFLGGQAVPRVMRYGYGYVQGNRCSSKGQW